MNLNNILGNLPPQLGANLNPANLNPANLNAVNTNANNSRNVSSTVLQAVNEKVTPLAYHKLNFGTTVAAEPINSDILGPKAIVTKIEVKMPSRLKELSEMECKIVRLRDAQQTSTVPEPTGLSDALEKLEAAQVKSLIKADAEVPAAISEEEGNEMQVESVPNQAAASNFSFTVRTLTWIATKAFTPEKVEYDAVLAPFFTSIPKPDTHVMMYNLWKDSIFQNSTLKVVVGNFLCEIPFNVDTNNLQPNTLKKVIVVVLPILGQPPTTTAPIQDSSVAPMNTDTQPPTTTAPTQQPNNRANDGVQGVKVMLFVSDPEPAEMGSLQVIKQSSVEQIIDEASKLPDPKG